jgi:hypothetical protein
MGGGECKIQTWKSQMQRKSPVPNLNNHIIVSFPFFMVPPPPHFQYLSHLKTWVCWYMTLHCWVFGSWWFEGIWHLNIQGSSHSHSLTFWPLNMKALHPFKSLETTHPTTLRTSDLQNILQNCTISHSIQMAWSSCVHHLCHSSSIMSLLH